MKGTDYLYVFLHIPKNAGSTFRYHIEKNLKSDERLLLDFDTLGIEGINPYSLNKKCANAVEKYFRSKTKYKLRKLRIIYGHRIPYSVHNYFSDRIVRYFTFFRDPVSRIVSIYNFKRGVYEDSIKSGVKRLGAKDTLLVNDEIPSFEKWIKEKYSVQHYPNSVYKFLESLGYLRGIKNNIGQALGRFYFIGTLEDFDNDSLYLYHKLGFKGLFMNQNISKKYYQKVPGKQLENTIRKKCRADETLYSVAKTRSMKFKKENLEYERIVDGQKVKSKLLMPFTQAFMAPGDTIKYFARKIIQ